MEILKLTTTIHSNGHLCMDVPTSLKPGPVEVVMVLHPQMADESAIHTYDFSDLAGKLKWTGDALACQKELRNEW